MTGRASDAATTPEEQVIRKALLDAASVDTYGLLRVQLAAAAEALDVLVANQRTGRIVHGDA